MLIGLAVLALLLQAMLDLTRAPVRQRDYELKLAAAERAAEAFQVLRARRQLVNAQVDLLNDPAGTGLIGPEYSQITNATGSLEAKLTSLNPNWAAILVEYFRQAGLAPGDPVALALSGSFPGLNISVYAAMETMRLRPVVITSVGASMWGANDPAFTWLDMESVLFEEGVFTTRSQLASFGGGNDMGRGLSPQGRRLIREAAARNDVPLLECENIEQAIARRMAFYEEQSRGRPYRCYVNVGGGVASLGDTHNRVMLGSGLIADLGQHNWPRKGTLILFAEKGVPVVHMLRLSAIAREEGLPVAPDYLPLPGEGEIFVRQMYRFPLTLAVLIGYCGLCVMILAPELRRGLFDWLPGRRPGEPTKGDTA
ncbi:MAG TPA: poly-gamma-glutamate system protein [Candidatus Krumholzibacteria bacterium]|nr:poly-gamma-glutamate system protein [Candidatus Krumholzibacteria bacterium]HRY40249.1 poly-gamma-glutamate system protein [Candidatus Krumholzibacteria bacterium]